MIPEHAADSSPPPEAPVVSHGREMHPPWVFRSDDLGRIFNLSDGIFAFSMTLLVLGLALPAGTEGPKLTSYLLSANFHTALFGYVIAFFVIGNWWRTHQIQFSYLRRYDRRLVQLNSIFLIFIAIQPFATEVLNASGSEPTGIVFFALIQIACGVASAGTWTYASRLGHLTDPALPGSWEWYLTWSTFSVPVVFGVSIPLALVSGGYAEIVWVAVFLVPFLARRQMQVQRPSTTRPANRGRA